MATLPTKKNAVTMYLLLKFTIEIICLTVTILCNFTPLWPHTAGRTATGCPPLP